MITLRARSEQHWDEEPFVSRLNNNPAAPLPLRERELYILSDLSAIPVGFRGHVYIEPEGGITTDTKLPEHTILLTRELSYLTAGDVVRVNPRRGELRVLYRHSSKSNAFLLTERCNSNCVMCSQPPRAIDDSYLVDECIEAIKLMSPDTAQLGLSGGEPTLLGDGLFRVIRHAKNYLPRTSLHMLSNGRLFSYLSLCREIAAIDHPDFMIGIPLYSDIAHQHDFIVQATNAFDETIRGIINLARCGVRIEVRVVLHRGTTERLPALAAFIARNLPFADHVALMGLELMGYTKMNLDALWIDPVDYQQELCTAVGELVSRRMNVSIYNHQLCTLDRSLWQFAKKSISDWKNEYLPECEHCSVKNDCGGFFTSGMRRYSKHIVPVQSQTHAA